MEATLRSRWAARDARYAMGRNQLTDNQVDAVRQWREVEARELAPQLMAMARTWLPPVGKR